MTPINAYELKVGDIAVSYQRSNSGSIILSYIHVTDQIFFEILGGKMLRIIQDIDNRYPRFKNWNIRRRKYVERKTLLTDIEFFKLTTDEINMLILDFI